VACGKVLANCLPFCPNEELSHDEVMHGDSRSCDREFLSGSLEGYEGFSKLFNEQTRDLKNCFDSKPAFDLKLFVFAVKC
jgi:hypothetical protein